LHSCFVWSLNLTPRPIPILMVLLGLPIAQDQLIAQVPLVLLVPLAPLAPLALPAQAQILIPTRRSLLPL